MASKRITPIPQEDIKEGVQWRNWFFNLRQYLVSPATSTTVGGAGAASALPATPVGYIVLNINGTDYKVPYYN
jgi:hypothetical protein